MEGDGAEDIPHQRLVLLAVPRMWPAVSGDTVGTFCNLVIQPAEKVEDPHNPSKLKQLNPTCIQYIYVSVKVCVDVYIYICTKKCTDTFMCVWVCICIYIYICICTTSLQRTAKSPSGVATCTARTVAEARVLFAKSCKNTCRRRSKSTKDEVHLGTRTAESLVMGLCKHVITKVSQTSFTRFYAESKKRIPKVQHANRFEHGKALRYWTPLPSVLDDASIWLHRSPK